MNVLDLGILAAVLGAGTGGWRLGFIARVFGWLGVAVGLAAGIVLVPGVVSRFGGSEADGRVSIALVFLVFVASFGQGAGLAVGALLRRTRPRVGGLARVDRAAGAGVGVLGVFVLVWMVIPSLATAQGWPARAARDSVVVALIEDHAPEQPDRFAAWGRSISDAPYPEALGTLDEPPDPGPPPRTALGADVDTRVRHSIVKVEGQACDQIQDGTGWVAASDLIVTNAHVVAGEGQTRVESEDGTEFDALVVAFDPRRDVAVLAVPGLSAPALPLGNGRVGEEGAVYGHPGGGALRAAPTRVGEEIVAVGTDIYRTGESRRDVFILAARLEPGDSGGPLLNREGTVIGVAFAIDPGRSATAYALTISEIRPVLEAINSAPVDTGPCVIG